MLEHKSSSKQGVDMVQTSSGPPCPGKLCSAALDAISRFPSTNLQKKPYKTTEVLLTIRGDARNLSSPLKQKHGASKKVELDQRMRLSLRLNDDCRAKVTQVDGESSRPGKSERSDAGVEDRSSEHGPPFKG